MHHHHRKTRSPMWVALAITVSLLGAQQAAAEDAESKGSVTLSLNQDKFFGFYPQVTGTYSLTENVALAFNAIFWQDVRGGLTVAANPWTEVGVGVDVSLLGGNLSVAPLLSTVSGQLLSARNLGTASRNSIFEGVVPNVTIAYDDSLFEGEIYAGYYRATRTDPEGEGVWDWVHYWGWFGVQPLKYFSVGVHWEHLLTTRDTGGDPADYYQWLGGYLEAKMPGDIALRFTAGRDVFNNDDFMKLRFAKTF